MTAFPRRFFVAWCAVALAATAHAQNPTAEADPFTVDEAVRLASANNPSLAASVRDVSAAAAGVRAARALANPEAVFTPGFSAGGSDTEFLLQQPLEINGTRAARTAVASARRRGVEATAVTTLREVVFATKSAYYELARARELLAVSEDLRKSAEEFDRITRRQVEVGARPGIDQIQTGIEVTRTRQQVAQAEGQVRIGVAALNTLLGRPPSEPIGALSPLSREAMSVNAEGALRSALDSRTEVAADEAERAALLHEARLARAEGRPDIIPQLRAGSVIRGVKEAGFGVGITLPFLDYGSRRERIRQSEQAARAQGERVIARRNQVRQEVEQALTHLQTAEEVVKEYSQGLLEQSKRLLDASRTGFQSGQTGILAVLEAQRTYRAVQTEYTGALVDHALALAELERATGGVPAERLPRLSEGAAGGNLSR